MSPLFCPNTHIGRHFAIPCHSRKTFSTRQRSKENSLVQIKVICFKCIQMNYFRQSCNISTAFLTNRLTAIFCLYYFQETLEEISIPRVEINGGRKPRIVEYSIKKVLKPVVDFRESLFDRCFAIDGYLANRMLSMGYKFPSRFGRWCPVKVISRSSCHA